MLMNTVCCYVHSTSIFNCVFISYPQPNPVKVKELCEFLSYWNGSSFICRSQVCFFLYKTQNNLTFAHGCAPFSTDNAFKLPFTKMYIICMYNL